MQIPKILFTAVLTLVSLSAVAQNQKAPSPTTVPDSINFIWKDVEHDFISLAEAMPEDRWSFRPTQGAFSNVRTFAEQVKHVACANEAWAKQIMGEKPPDRCDQGGPNPAKSKGELLAYLRASFALVDRAIEGSSRENLLQSTPGPYWGPNRLSALVAEVWHVSDHYGQLVEYLRMNNVVPPASR
jgi:uncharacterized damage-inducible protein DinB